MAKMAQIDNPKTAFKLDLKLVFLSKNYDY